MNYLTWRELFALREKMNPTDEQLDEPVLFCIQDAYGNDTAYPVELLTESIHPGDGTRALYLSPNGEELDLDMPTRAQGVILDEDDEPDEDDEDEEEPRRLLRKLPLGGLRLGFSEMDEDFEEATEWLAQRNPHTPPPAPGRAPLFE